MVRRKTCPVCECKNMFESIEMSNMVSLNLIDDNRRRKYRANSNTKYSAYFCRRCYSIFSAKDNRLVIYKKDVYVKIKGG